MRSGTQLVTPPVGEGTVPQDTSPGSILREGVSLVPCGTEVLKLSVSGSQPGAIWPPGNIGRCLETFLVTAARMPLASAGWSSGMLLDIPQHTGQTSPQRMTQPRASTLLRPGSPALGHQHRLHDLLNHICWAPSPGEETEAQRIGLTLSA